MTKEAEFLRKLKGLMKVPVFTFAAKVLEVDEATASLTVEPLDGRPKVFEVRIKSTIDSESFGLFIYPPVDSVVLVSLIGNDPKEAYLVRCNAVDKVFIKIGENTFQFDANGIEMDFEGQTLKIDDTGFVFNGGGNKGLLNIDDVVNSFNTIINDVNELKQIFTAWVPVPQDGGAALKSAVSSWSGSNLNTTENADMEDDKITH